MGCRTALGLTGGLVMMLVLGGVTAGAVAQGQAPPPELPPTAASEQVVLPPLLVTAPPPVASSSEQLIPGKDFEVRPQGRPGDVLRLVPGLIIAQHQGGGKAEQYLIRGFDADHGTDLALFVDGLPVNLRSHAHGQGYADLHFLIPETVEVVDVLKGPYFPEYGDFDTAGVVNFRTKAFVPENTLSIAGGRFNTQRYLALLSPTREAIKTLVAVEGFHTDGPFEHPSGYNRLNIFAKASAMLAEDMTLSLWASYYQADWHGSGQIPERAVREGLITRLGSIDPSEGGQYTHRDNLNVDYLWKLTDNQRLTAHAYVTYYDLSLFNDFTFFRSNPDPLVGDEINQRDHRMLAGFDTQYEAKAKPLGVNVNATIGFQYRIDTPHLVLARATERHQTRIVQNVDIVEQSSSPFVKLDIVPIDKVRFVGGVRADIFNYHGTQHVNAAEGNLTGNITRERLGEKANLILGPWYETEFFANYGTGFHSNDARAVLASPKLTALPTAEGYEFGVKTRVLPRTELFATYWVLNLQSELVFNGDAGTTEAAGPTHRAGIELGGKVHLLDWLTFTGDFTYTTNAEFVHPTLMEGDRQPGRAIPLAPIWTARWDLTARLPWGLASSLEMRYLGDRPADPDRAQTARGYTLFNWTTRYRSKNLEAFLSIENLFDAQWREGQFFFVSRLPGEPAAGVPDIHFTPGAPRSVLGGLAVHF